MRGRDMKPGQPGAKRFLEQRMEFRPGHGCWDKKNPSWTDAEVFKDQVRQFGDLMKWQGPGGYFAAPPREIFPDREEASREAEASRHAAEEAAYRVQKHANSLGTEEAMQFEGMCVEEEDQDHNEACCQYEEDVLMDDANDYMRAKYDDYIEGSF
ncbi:unnamed protein product, partial [Scytosiphon promiscuus]